VPLDFIQQVFQVMRAAPQHCFQVLTKRAERLAELAPRLTWSDNIWQGVTVESADYLHRLDSLRQVPSKLRFLSLEPLLGPLPGLDLTGIDWVIVGGESGPGARPLDEDWVLEIRDRCLRAEVPFFFKQWGGTNKKKAGRELQGRLWSQLPRAA
jgi:protein gp37